MRHRPRDQSGSGIVIVRIPERRRRREWKTGLGVENITVYGTAKAALQGHNDRLCQSQNTPVLKKEVAADSS